MKMQEWQYKEWTAYKPGQTNITTAVLCWGSARLSVRQWLDSLPDHERPSRETHCYYDADGDPMPIFRHSEAAKEYAAALVSNNAAANVMVAVYPTPEIAKAASRGEWAVQVEVMMPHGLGSYPAKVGNVEAQY